MSSKFFEKGRKVINWGFYVVGQTIENNKEKVSGHIQLEGLKSEYVKAAVSLADKFVEIGELPEGYSEEVIQKYNELIA